MGRSAWNGKFSNAERRRDLGVRPSTECSGFDTDRLNTVAVDEDALGVGAIVGGHDEETGAAFAVIA
jgi:hypothetical protein